MGNRIKAKGRNCMKTGGAVFNRGGLVPPQGQDKKLIERHNEKMHKGQKSKLSGGGKVMCKGF